MVAITKAQRKKIEQIRRYQNLFNSDEGKWVLMDLMKSHHMLGPLPDRHPGEIHRAEGERNVILRILSLMNVDSKALEERIKNVRNLDDYTEE